jgi:hypothetical protein
MLGLQVLLELEPAPHQATELSGDAGAVGRLVAAGVAGMGSMYGVCVCVLGRSM